MSESRLVGVSSSERTLDERDLRSLRPATQSAPRPRKAPVVREVTSGIVCLCGERFSEAQALEFMLHLRAEVGRDLAILQRQRERDRRKNATPKARAQRRERGRRYWADPENRERQRERAKLLAAGAVEPLRRRSPEVKAADAKAAALRQRGYSYRQIARELGCSPAAAHQAVQRDATRRD